MWRTVVVEMSQILGQMDRNYPSEWPTVSSLLKRVASASGCLLFFQQVPRVMRAKSFFFLLKTQSGYASTTLRFFPNDLRASLPGPARVDAPALRVRKTYFKSKLRGKPNRRHSTRPLMLLAIYVRCPKLLRPVLFYNSPKRLAVGLN